MNTSSRTLLTLIALFLAVQLWSQNASSTGDIFYVDFSGDDGNPGNADRPFRTISHAAALMNPGDRCVIGSGVYHEAVVPRHSGTKLSPITFVAATGERPVISGTSQLTGWSRHSGNIWKAPMPWSLGKNNQVFYNGTMLQEARWPNKPESAGIMTPAGAYVSEADSMGIECDDFPEFFAEIDSWEGTVIWVMARSKWTSWSKQVEGYDAGRKKVIFPIPDISRGHMSPVFPRENHHEFYLANHVAFLDQPGEWYYNEDEKMLYMIPPDGTDPGNARVTAKRRMTAFDLEDKSHIHISGIDIHAATINMENASNCMVRDVRASYISHSRGGETGYSMGEKTGIYITGTGNVIRDSEIAFSVEHGIYLGGTGNAVINCHIHTINYYGCYGTPVRVFGYGNMVSHCTINESGRDGIQISGQAHLIQYNHVYHVGLISHDLGMLYTVGNDGGGTEIRHNVFHDNLSKGHPIGLYLDNFTSNYICHHNVVWGIRNDPIRLNKPSEYNIIAHNTAFGNLNNWGRWESDGMFGVLVINNLLNGQITPHPDQQVVNNVTGASMDSSSPLKAAVAENRSGINKGVYIPGISGMYKGEAPDVGAYELGLPFWQAGHDFNNPPFQVYRLSDTPFRNRIFNACFELSSFIEPPSEGDRLIGWERTDACNAEVISGSGGIAENPETRDTYISNGVKFSGNGNDGILQEVNGLEPNTSYIVAGWLKTGDATGVRIGIRDHGDDERYATVTGQNWEQPVVGFTTGPESSSATLFIQKIGDGTAFADNIGLIPAISWLQQNNK